MAIVSGTYLTYSSIGNREDLSDVIYNISPEETPFMSGAGRGKAKATFHEWQIDSLAAAVSTNQVIEGDEATFATPTATTRLGNRLQISRKTLILSDTQEVIDKAGRKSEEAYQLAKRSAELKLDMEKQSLENIASVSGDSTTARVTAGLGAFVKTNDSVGAGGASPVYTSEPNAARTDGTQRDLTEALLKTVIQSVWTAGGTPKVLMVGPFNKTVVSDSTAFPGIAQITYNLNSPKMAAVIGAVSVYVSDFGTLSVVPNRHQRERDAWVLDFDFVSFVYLRPFKKVSLAKTGDAEKKMLIVEWGLKVHNEAALGLVADLNVS